MKRPFLYIFIPFSIGIYLAHAAELPSSALPMAAAIAAGALFTAAFLFFSKRKILSHVLLYAAICSAGIAYYQHSVTLPSEHIANVTPAHPAGIFLRGTVVDDPVVETTFYHKEKASFTVSVSSYKKGEAWKRAQGLVRVDRYFAKPEGLSYGDEITAGGLLYRPSGLKNPGLFDYANYLGLKDIYSILKVGEKSSLVVTGRMKANPVSAFAYRIRNKIRSVIDAYLDYPYSGFINAILIGDRSDLPENITDDFIMTGTVHILAISGLNLGIIAGIILAVFGVMRVPKKLNLVLTLAAVSIYSITAGASPPVIRAAVIFAVCVVGYLIGRRHDMLNSLAIAGFAILLWNPKELFDPSFQLSFGSVASIMVLSPHLERLTGFDVSRRRTFGEKARCYFIAGLTVSIAAWIGTWPIVALYFNIVSPISIIANLVIVPAMSVITVVATAFLGAGLFSHLAAAYLAEALRLITKFTFYINHIFAGVPFAYSRVGSMPTWALALYFTAISLFLTQGASMKRFFAAHRRAALAGVLFACNVFVWRTMLPADQGVLRITFLDVGQGDSALIESPSGERILVDGGVGGAEGKFDMGKNVIAPYLWNHGVRRLDAVVVTHFHDDHLGGIIYILKNFPVGMIIDNGARPSGDATYDAYIAAIKKRNIRRVMALEGDVLRFGDVEFFVLNPQKGKDASDPNNDSIVMKLVSKRASVLLCGDVQEPGIGRLSSYGPFLRSEIIKIPHHGSSLGKEISVRNFLEIVDPKIAVISVARINNYDAPSRDVMNAITNCNIKSYITKDSGAVIITKK